MRIKVTLLLAALTLFGIGCTRKVTPPPPQAPPPAPAPAPTAPQPQEEFPDRLEDGFRDLELIEDIK